MMLRFLSLFLACFVLVAGLAVGGVNAADYVETPFFEKAVADGSLPAVGTRLPEDPRRITVGTGGRQVGKHGGDIRTLIGGAKDTKLMFVYGYARLVTYDRDLNIEPDILKAVDVEDNRIFTLRLRKGHKWSDGHPFTSDDFRYWWDDVANNPKLSPAGPSAALLVNGEMPKVEFPDELTVRYSWSSPNPNFLPLLAGASPLLIYRPKHYLKQFHENHVDLESMNKIQRIKFKSWASKHNRLDNLYKFDNPDLPTLQPWRNITHAPANRFIGERNPYFHRVDENGRQLPYVDRLILSISESKLISAKAAAGDVDLQARALQLQDATFLKENEERSGYHTRLWPTARGSHVALFPNLTHSDPFWRKLLRDVRFRRALSMGIDREEINDTLFFGLAVQGNNTAQQQSPFYSEELQTKWAEFDVDAANALLDDMGLVKRNDKGIRLLPDGKPLIIIVETAGESTEQTDILELIRDSWAQIGIELFTKPSQRNVFRNRIFAGQTVMSVWSGFENGVPNPKSSPAALAATSQHSYQWPKWGQYFETKGKSGEAVDMKDAQRLNQLYGNWLVATDDEARSNIWREMLAIHADQQFTIGIVSSILQPIVVSKRLRNLPKEAMFNWDPGAQFGIYQPDTLWYE